MLALRYGRKEISAVNALGYHYPGYGEALKAQIDKLLHISNLYYNEPMSEAGEKLVKASGMNKAFFTNSGTEAIEGALKAARKYAYAKGEKGKRTLPGTFRAIDRRGEVR